MSIHLDVVDISEVFRNLRDKPIIINDYETTSISDKNFIRDLIYTKYDNDVLSSIPRCNCPNTANPIIGADRQGEYCPNCNTKVTARFDDELESILWVRAPEGVEPFINPRIWHDIKATLGNRRVDILSWLTNTAYKPKNGGKPEILTKLEELGIKRVS